MLRSLFSYTRILPAYKVYKANKVKLLICGFNATLTIQIDPLLVSGI